MTRSVAMESDEEYQVRFRPPIETPVPTPTGGARSAFEEDYRPSKDAIPVAYPVAQRHDVDPLAYQKRLQLRSSAFLFLCVLTTVALIAALLVRAFRQKHQHQHIADDFEKQGMPRRSGKEAVADASLPRRSSRPKLDFF